MALLLGDRHNSSLYMLQNESATAGIECQDGLPGLLQTLIVLQALKGPGEDFGIS